MRDDEDRGGGESADAQSDQGRWKVSRSSIALMTASHSASKDYARHWDYEEGSIDLPPLSLPGEAVDDGLAYPGRIAHRKTAVLGDEGAGGKGHKGAMPVGERPSVLPGSYDFLNSVTMASQPEVPAFPPTDLPADGHGGKDSSQEPSPRRVVARRELEASKATGTAIETPAQQKRPAAKVVWSWTKPETNKGPAFSWNMPKRRKPSASTRAGKPAASVAKTSSVPASSANAVDSAGLAPSKAEQESSKASAPAPSAVETAEPKSVAMAGAPSVSGSEDSMSAKPSSEVSAPATSVHAPATPVVFADRPVVVRRSDADWDSLVTGSPAPAGNGAGARSVVSEADHQGRRVCSTPRVGAQPAAVAGNGAGGRVVSSKTIDGHGTALAQKDLAGQPMQTGQEGIAVQPAPSESSEAVNAAPGMQSVVQFASSPTSVSSPGASVALAARAAEAAAAAVAAKAVSAETEGAATDATKPSGSSHGLHLGLPARGHERSGGARRSSKRRSARNRLRPSVESAAPRVVSNASAEPVTGASRPAPVSSHPTAVPSELDAAKSAAAVAAQAQGQPEKAKSAVSEKSTSYTASSRVLHAVNGQAAFAFVYLAISVLVLMVGSGMILPVIMEQIRDPGSIAFLSDGITLLSVLLGLAYACISEWSVIRGVDQRGQDAVRWHTGRRMTLAALLALAAVLLLGQGMVHELNKFFNYFCPLLHIPSLASRSLLVTGASSPMMALYALLAVPLAEELVFRGIILNGLRRFGRVFAILTASLLCALLQSDPVSGLWIFLLGLALGYCSLEYGLIWAIGARAVGDLLFSGLPNRYLMSASRTGRLLVLAVALVLVLAGLLMFFLHRASLLDYRRRYRAPKGTYVSWRQPWFLLYFLLCLLLTVFKFVPGLL